MCAEAVPWQCHRTLIADALVARGVEVRHILGPDRADAHALHADASVRPDGVLVLSEFTGAADELKIVIQLDLIGGEDAEA